VTINLPEKVTEEMVSQVYMEAWKCGCKGLTVYREGSRSGVLVATTKENGESELQWNYFEKRPTDIECDIHCFSSQGKRWICFLGKINGKPYEIFVHPYEKFQGLSFAIKHGFLRKAKQKDKRKVFTFYTTEQEQISISSINEVPGENKWIWDICLLISGLLRHNMPVELINKKLQCMGSEEKMDSSCWHMHICRILSKYISKQGEGLHFCPNCSAELIVEKNAVFCTHCSFSK